MKFTKMPVTNIDKILYSYFHDIVFMCDTTDDIKKIIKGTDLGFDLNLHNNMKKHGIIVESNDIIIFRDITCYNINKDGDIITFILSIYDSSYIEKCINHFKFKLRTAKIKNIVSGQKEQNIRHKKTNLTKLAV